MVVGGARARTLNTLAGPRTGTLYEALNICSLPSCLELNSGKSEIGNLMTGKGSLFQLFKENYVF